MTFILKKAVISALVALVLFFLMIGIRTDAGPSAQLIYWTRFGQLAAVVAAPDDKWGEVPIAYVELKTGRTATEAEIIEHCRTLLARFKCPKAVIFAEIPKTSTGKIQKYRLREMARWA